MQIQSDQWKQEVQFPGQLSAVGDEGGWLTSRKRAAAKTFNQVEGDNFFFNNCVRLARPRRKSLPLIQSSSHNDTELYWYRLGVVAFDTLKLY